jgi:hypothetical protein
MEEVRVAGKYGTKGWSKKYGEGHVTDAPDNDADADEDAPKPSKKHKLAKK